MGPPGSLITVTYAMGEGKLRDARCASRDWTALIRQLKVRSPKLMWFKIPELTKKGQIHYHAIVLAMRSTKDCCKSMSWGRCDHHRGLEWYERSCREDCIEHELSRAWYEITGDSWVVDSRPILGARGAASYLSKYLVKAYDNRRELESRGFARRWSCSRNWPAPVRMQLAVTNAGGWDSTNFMGAKSSMKDTLRKEVKAAINDPWAIKVGTPMAEKLEKRRVRSKLGKRKDMIYEY